MEFDIIKWQELLQDKVVTRARARHRFILNDSGIASKRVIKYPAHAQIICVSVFFVIICTYIISLIFNKITIPMCQRVSYWANIDIPTETFTIHRSDCYYKPRATQNKGVNKIKRYGGWMSFKDIHTATTVYNDEYSKFTYNLCKFCKP